MTTFPRKRRNIDQLLRDDLIFQKPAAKTTSVQIESALRSKNLLGHRRLHFEESTEELKATELIDFTGVIVLEGMDAFVGTSSGILKGVTLSKSSFVNLRPSASDVSIVCSEQKKEMLASITAMSFTGKDQMEVLVGRSNGQIDLYNTISDRFNMLFTMSDPGKIKGIQAINGDRILTARENGELGIWNGLGERKSSESWSAGEDLLTMRIGPGEKPDLFATGGKENPLKLWDLNEEKCTFVAKNVRPDALELRVPIWVTCCRFLDNTGKCIVTSTGKSQLRVYDTRTQRRPILEESWLEEPIQALSTCCRDWNVLAGNSRGELGLFDLRSTAKTRLAGKFKGFAGAIRSIDASASQPQVLSCGIDRFAILHDLNTRQVLRKIYCKVQLNCCLLREDNSLQQQSGRRREN